METYIHPNNRGTQVRVSRNDIWFNLKQIQSATSTIQQTYPGIPFEFHNPLETDKDKVKRQKANGATARSMQKDMIQYFTKNLLPLYEEMEALYKNNVIPFENTDDEYVKTAKEKMETYLDPAKLLATAQKQNRGAVVNFVKGMWSSVKGVAGLAKTAVEYSVAGTAFVYGKVTGKMPKWAEKRMGNAKEFAKKVWQDPFSILEGMGQGLSDTYENEGVSYLAGAFVGDYLIAKGATKAVKAMKKPKSGKVGSEVGGGKKASGLTKAQKVENFQNRVDNIRNQMPNSKLKNQGNMAVADVKIKDLPDEFMAHSKIHGPNSKGADLGNFSPSSENRIFESYTIDKFPRYNDTEVKILEDIASKIKDPNISGKIDLFTELPACQSCTNVILEFRKKFPNIELNIFTK